MAAPVFWTVPSASLTRVTAAIRTAFDPNSPGPSLRCQAQRGNAAGDLSEIETGLMTLTPDSSYASPFFSKERWVKRMADKPWN